MSKKEKSDVKVFNQAEFGKNLTLLMKNMHIKQKDIVEATGIQQPKLSALQNGKSSPSITEMVILSDYFNVSIDQILFGKKVELRYRSYTDIFNSLCLLIDDDILKIDTYHNAGTYKDYSGQSYYGYIYHVAGSNGYDNAIKGNIFIINNHILVYLLNKYVNLRHELKEAPEALESWMNKVQHEFDYPIIRGKNDIEYLEDLNKCIFAEKDNHSSFMYADALRIINSTDKNEKSRWEEKVRQMRNNSHKYELEHVTPGSVEYEYALESAISDALKHSSKSAEELLAFLES